MKKTSRMSAFQEMLAVFLLAVLFTVIMIVRGFQSGQINPTAAFQIGIVSFPIAWIIIHY
jgi:hypothetical protein